MDHLMTNGSPLHFPKHMTCSLALTGAHIAWRFMQGRWRLYRSDRRVRSSAGGGSFYLSFEPIVVVGVLQAPSVNINFVRVYVPFCSALFVTE